MGFAVIVVRDKVMIAVGVIIIVQVQDEDVILVAHLIKIVGDGQNDVEDRTNVISHGILVLSVANLNHVESSLGFNDHS